MKESKSPFPVSSIEFDKIYRVMDKRLSLGYSARELSFLLGQHPMYVRDVENPLDTHRYTAKHTNYLLNIFDCKLAEIMAGKIVEPFYQISVKESKYAGGITYKIFRDISPEERILYREFTIEAVDTEDKNLNRNQIIEITQFLTSLFHSDYFDVPKTALEIFKLCKAGVGSSIRPHCVFTALNTFKSRKVGSKLDRKKNESGRFAYGRVS